MSREELDLNSDALEKLHDKGIETMPYSKDVDTLTTL